MRHAGNIAFSGAPGQVSGKPVLIYNGECPICVRATDWIRVRSDPDAFEFVSCHSEILEKRFPGIEKEACLKAMHLVLPGGKAMVGELAIPEILKRLPRHRWCASLFRLPGAGILSRACYLWFAKNRHRFHKISSPAP